MIRFILDTTTITLLLWKHQQVTTKVHAQPPGTVGITTVTVEEVVGGWFTKLRQARTNAQEAFAAARLAEATALLGRFPILPTTELALDRYDTLVKIKLNVGRKDLKIVAVGLELPATVVTDNARDFGRVPGLAWVDWTV